MSIKMFTTEEMLLAMEFKRLNRFRIRKVRDLKAGLHISVRSVPSQPNIIGACLDIQRVPHMRRGNYPALILGKSRYVFHIENGEKRVFTESEHPSTWKYLIERETYVSDWMYYNACYRYNAKVMDAVHRLMKVSPFSQYCIIKSLPVNERTYLDYVDRKAWSALVVGFDDAR